MKTHDALPSPRPRRRLRLLATALLFPAFALAQTTIDIDGATRVSNGSGGYTYSTWKPLLGYIGNQFTDSQGHTIDPVYDQQTGQGDSDFVSIAGTPGFFIQFGQINGVDHLAFRVMMNEYKTTGNLVNIRFGFDGDYDGAPDLFMGLSQQNNQTGLVFQAPGTGSNLSPSTTTLGNAFYPTGSRTGLPALNDPDRLAGLRAALTANNSALALTADNFSNVAIGDGVNKDIQGGQGTVIADNRATYYPGWTTQAENNATSLDSMISFAIPLADINAALASLGEGFSVTPDRLMLWMAVTATQNNSVNQDAYGTDKAGFSSNYSSFLQYMDAYGRPVPEASSYGLLLGAGLGGVFLLRRKRRASAPRSHAGLVSPLA